MKAITLSLLLPTLLLVTACSRNEPTPTGAATSPTSPCPQQAQGYMPFPAGVVPAFAYHLRDDRIYAHASGITRRRVTLEFLESDGATALASLTDSMIEGGFKAGPQKQGDQGRISIALTKKGLRGTTHLTLNPSAGPKPRNPLAKGVLTLDYPLPNSATPSRSVVQPEASTGQSP